MPPLYHIRGRQLDSADIETIQAIITRHWDQGRSAISRLLCACWDWRQANGLLKERACRVLLFGLESKGVITLPPRLHESYRFPKKTSRKSHLIDSSEITGKVSDFGTLTFKMVRRSPEETLWDYLIDTHHYLGRPWIVGSYLKYLAFLDDRLVACLGWGSAAWTVAARDQFIGWADDVRVANLHKVVNNVRFLVLPWVKIENLASKLLAANARILAADWRSFYRQDIVLLETFVDTTRFTGVCYRAANWLPVGLTKGRGKYDRGSHTVKAIWLYPLTKHFREHLHGG